MGRPPTDAWVPPELRGLRAEVRLATRNAGNPRLSEERVLRHLVEVLETYRTALVSHIARETK
jgi:hypothetical protein